MIITGNIGRAAETKTTKGGREYLAFSVAESYGKEDNRTTNWFSIALYCKPEEMAGFRTLLTQGTRVEVNGDLKVTPKDGKVFLDVMTSRVKAAPLPPKKDGAPAPAGQANASAPAPAAAAPGAPGGVTDQYNDMDDDIPF